MTFVTMARQLCTVEPTRLGCVFPVTGMSTVRMRFHSATRALCYVKGATCILLGFAAHPVRLVSVNPAMTTHITRPWLPRNTSGTSWSASLGVPLQQSSQLCGLVTTAVNVVMLTDLLHHCLPLACWGTAKALVLLVQGRL